MDIFSARGCGVESFYWLERLRSNKGIRKVFDSVRDSDWNHGSNIPESVKEYKNAVYQDIKKEKILNSEKIKKELKDFGIVYEEKEKELGEKMERSIELKKSAKKYQKVLTDWNKIIKKIIMSFKVFLLTLRSIFTKNYYKHQKLNT